MFRERERKKKDLKQMLNESSEREREKEERLNKGSFHKPEVVLSPLHFQGEFTKM